MFYKSSGRLQTAERRIVDDTQERLLHRLGRYRQRPYFRALRWIDSPRQHFGLPWVRLGQDEPARAKSAQQGQVRAVAGTDDQDRSLFARPLIHQLLDQRSHWPISGNGSIGRSGTLWVRTVSPTKPVHASPRARRPDGAGSRFAPAPDSARSEERRVGKECGSTFRARWSPLD